MVLTRLEKIAFVSLVALLGLGVILLIGKLGLARERNRKIELQIQQIAALTDQNVLIKDDSVDLNAEASKLNLNRADLASIRALPGMTTALAKRIHAFVQSRGGEVSNMSDLLAVTGVNPAKLRELEHYATVIGGHAGRAAWGDKVNLNFASIDELSTLPGIGKVTAKKIVDFRNRNGGIFSLEDLKEIPGLTPKTIAKFIDRVEVR